MGYATAAGMWLPDRAGDHFGADGHREAVGALPVGARRDNETASCWPANIAAHVIPGLGAITMIAPFLWISPHHSRTWRIFILPARWLPRYWSWNNYSRIGRPRARQATYSSRPSRSQFLTASDHILGTVGQLFSCSNRGLRVRTPAVPAGRNTIFVGLLMTLMPALPAHVIPRLLHHDKPQVERHALPLIIPFFCAAPTEHS